MFAKKTSKPKVAGGLFAFVGISAVAAVLLGFVVTPAVATTGISANGTAGLFDELPDYLKLTDLAEKTSLYAKDKDGKEVLLASFYAQNRVTVPLTEISPYVIDAAVAAEDPRFYEHGGIDIWGTIRATVSNFVGSKVQGGSSISQQYVKNILVMRAEDIADPVERKAAYQTATATNLDRKVKELRYAMGLESQYSKDDILNGYLNIASFGGRVYGIEAAAERYFGVKAKDLTLGQAASLIATVNNPNNLRIDNPDLVSANQDRRNWVLDRMLAEGKITQQQHDEAQKEPVTPKITPATSGCETAGGSAFFCDYVTWVIKNDKAFGNTEDERWAAFVRGGWKIMTTLDLEAQAAAVASLNENVPKIVPEGDIGGSAVSVEVGTGRILTMAQSKDYSADPDVVKTGANYTSVNFNADGNYGSSAGFPVGSTYKLFTLEEWLKQGHGLNEVVSGAPKEWKMSEFTNSCDGTGGPVWRPLNYAGAFDSTTTVMNALKASYNTNFVTMASKLDLCNIRKNAEALLVHRADYNQLKSNPSTVLGTEEIAPLTMAVATAGIANDGKVCSAIAIDSITDRNGKNIKPPLTTCSQAMTSNIARTMAYGMENVHSPGGTASRASVGDNIPFIAKTGTSDNAEHNWILASTSKVSTVVWLGNVTGHVALSSVRFTGGEQYNTKQDIWRDIMTVVNARYGGAAFGAPDQALLKGRSLIVPDITGLTKDQAKDLVQSVGLSFVDAGQIDSELPLDTVVKAEPGVGAAAPIGGSVKVYFSNHTLVAGPPNIVGMTVLQATTALTAAGFNIMVTTNTATPTPCPSPNNATPCPQPTSTVLPDQRVILTQSSTGGFLKPGTIITVTVQG